MDTEILIVSSNFPDRASAERVAEALVAANLAACVNISAGCSSIYRWEGKVERATEVPLLIKTTRAAYARLESVLRELHPYELPELIAVPVTTGLPAYLAWVEQETQPRKDA